MKRIGKGIKKVTETDFLKAEVERLNKEKQVLENKVSELETLAKKVTVSEPTVEKIKSKLKELGIEFNNNATKAELLALLPKEQ